MAESIQLHVNGKTHTVSADPATPLLTVLRNTLGLNAARFGCGLEQCGACKVIIDGEAVPSCDLKVIETSGKSITTLEGISADGELHPVQTAFLEEQAAQCGYCTAGMIIAVKALLDRNPQPTDADIREALQVHVCRCGIHHRILKAVHRAAEAMVR